MKTLLVFLLPLVFCLETTYFPGRSGDITVQPKVQPNDDSFIILIDNMDEVQHTPLANGNIIQEENVVNLVAHLVGTQMLSEVQDYSEFPASSLFKKARANLLITVNGVGSEILAVAPKLSTLGNQMKLERQYYPIDPVSSLTTVMTGQRPSVHGIVGRTWFDKTTGARINAYKSSTGRAQVVNYVDTLNLAFAGQSLTVSLSSDLQLAAAAAPNRMLIEKNPNWNNLAFYWDHKSGAFKNVHNLPKHLLNTLKVIFSEDTFPADSGIEFVENKLVVSLRGMEPVSFDLALEEDNLFFTEIAGVRELVRRLAIHGPLTSLVDDDIPDFFSFSFAGLKALKEKYTSQPKKIEVAMRLMDEFISEIVSDLNRVYQSRLVAEVIFQADVQVPEFSKEALQSLQNYLMSSFEWPLTYPQIFLNRAIKLEERDRLCIALRPLLKDSVPVCPSPELFEHRFFSRLPFETNNSTNTTGYTTNEIAAFNISLWFTLFLFFCSLGGVYAMMTIGWSVTSDSLLYKQSRRYYKQE